MKPTVRYALLYIACGTAFLLSTGCNKPIMLKAKNVDHIDLMTQPVAANLDGMPGPDGLQVKVYLYNEDKTISGKGKLEMMMFDGNESLGDLYSSKPIKTWTFSSDQLKPFMASSYGLLHYQLALEWGDNKPTSKTVTILAHFTNSDGKKIVSQPVVVPVMLE